MARHQVFTHIERQDDAIRWTASTLQKATEDAWEKISEAAQENESMVQDIRMVVVNNRVITFIGVLLREEE